MLLRARAFISITTPLLQILSKLKSHSCLLPLHLLPHLHRIPHPIHQHTLWSLALGTILVRSAPSPTMSPLIVTSLETKPTSFTQANSKLKWRNAMAIEMNALALNNTWTLVPPCPNQQVVGFKWVYKIKQQADGSIKRYKARLVTQGFREIESIDYFNTSSLVVWPTTIRLIFSIAVSSHLPIRQVDVRNVFLNGDHTEQVFMCQPPVLLIRTTSTMCAFSVKLYTVSNNLQRLSFHYSRVCCFQLWSLLLSHAIGHTTIVLWFWYSCWYIDHRKWHLSFAPMYHTLATSLFSQRPWSSKLLFRYWGSKHSLGLHLSQTKYLQDLLTQNNMQTAKCNPTHMAVGSSIFGNNSAPFDNLHL